MTIEAVAIGAVGGEEQRDEDQRVDQAGTDVRVGAETQGSPISPLLANIACNALDRAWARTSGYLGALRGTPTISSSFAPAGPGPRRPGAGGGPILGPLGLQLNPDKTRIVCLTEGAEGFDFLGFHCHKVESWR